MKKRYTLVLNFGYVESQSLSFMPWTSNKTFKDAKEALVDLAMFFKEQYLKEDEPRKKCCEATKAKDASAEFCSKCGYRLDDAEFDGEGFSSWLSQMSGCDNDSMGSYVEWDPAHPWQYGSLEGAPNQRFVYQAEWVLAAALGHPKDEKHTFEKICKERTKSRRDSFTYY